MPSSLAAKLGTQTAKGMPYGAGTASALSWTNALTNGQIVIGSTAGTPQAANITSTGSSITITNGSNTINLEAAASVPTSFATDSGTAIPALNILTVAGGTNINTSGAGSTVTINLNSSISITNATFAAGGAARTSTGVGNTFLIQAYDTDTGPAYTTFITLTAGTVPTCDLSDSVTKAGGYIYRAGGTDVALADGGTNASLVASNGGIFYSTASAGAILAGTATAGQFLVSGASSAPSWTSASFPVSAAQGDIIYGSATNVWSTLPKDANATRYLSNTGTSNNPAWAQINLTNGVTGTLPVGNGGTGSASFNVYGPVVAGSTTTTALVSVVPSATSGVPFISQGSSANPVFGTAVVAGGGTGNTTFTAYSVICAGTTATGAFQNVSGVGSAGQVLKSNGAAALPTWQNDSATNTWTDQGSSTTVSSNVNYFVTAAATLTLPTTPSQGDTISFYVDTASSVVIDANTGQTLRLSTGTSTSSGTATNSSRGDCLTIVYRTSGALWAATNITGNWTLA